MVQFTSLLFFLLNIFIYADRSDLRSTRPEVTINYNLSTPDRTYILPKSLNEISGITGTDATSIACIQDENGILFIYDLEKEQIRKQYAFYNNGDYEGIAQADKTAWILRSDGMLFEVTNFESGGGKTVSYSTGIPAKDNEGLCFDKSANRLLIAPKSKVEDKTVKKDQRFIFAFDLQSKKLIAKPAFVINVSLLIKFALENNIKIPKGNGNKGDNNEPFLEFRPSAIGIHPITNRLFVVSGVEKMLFVFDMKGNIEFMKKLDKDLFLQPEGITFLKNGDMLISNEGQNKKPTILRFNYGVNLKD